MEEDFVFEEDVPDGFIPLHVGRKLSRWKRAANIKQRAASLKMPDEETIKVIASRLGIQPQDLNRSTLRMLVKRRRAELEAEAEAVLQQRTETEEERLDRIAEALNESSAPNWREWVKEHMELHGVVANDLATVTGMSKGNLSKWLNGSETAGPHMPSQKVARIMQLLGWGLEGHQRRWKLGPVIKRQADIIRAKK